MPKSTKKQGFTLIELLVVVAIISILAVTVFVALDPVRRFSEARNSRRWSDVNSYLTAIHQYIVDNDGSLPTGLDTTLRQVGTCTSGGDTLCPGAAAACLNMQSDLARYLKSMPFDKVGGSAATTGYTVQADANNLITVSACGSELSEVVEVSR